MNKFSLIFALILSFSISISAFAQNNNNVLIQGIYNGARKNIAVASDGSILISGGSFTNAAAGPTGSAVPSSASYNGINVGGTLRGQTGTNTSGSVYAGDVNIAGAPAITFNATSPSLTDTQTVTDLQIDPQGGLITAPYATPANLLKGVTAAITDTTSTQLIAAQASGIKIYVTKFTCTNSHASVDTFVKLLDGSTVIDEILAVHGAGFSVNYPSPINGSAATALNAQPVTTGSNTICSASGYKGR